MSAEAHAGVRARYAAIARSGGGCGGSGGSGCCGSSYPEADRAALPEAAAVASLGCGNPVAVAELREGETVLDLGSGGGIDVILSARRVGPTGRPTAST